MSRILPAVLAVLGVLTQGSAFAQNADKYPDHAIRLVVPYAPGGPTDVVARAVAQFTTPLLGQSVVVENRPGAAGVLGADYVAKSPGDGYTVLLCAAGAMAINSILMPNMPYVPLRDLRPITHVVSIPYLLLVNPSSPFHSVQDLIAAAKAKPGKLNYGSAGQGSSSNLAGELLKMKAGIDVQHIPYKGSVPADQDLLGGRLDMLFDAVPPALPLIRSQKLRALAIASDKRLPLFADLPTFAEAGVPDFEVSTWLGICSPASTPPAIVDKLNRLIVQGTKQPDAVKLYTGIGGEIVADTPQQFRTFIEQEQKRWSEVIKTAHITAGS